MKREVRLLKAKAIESLLMSIEHFNRPSEQGRTEAVLIFLDHAFEMLLKAAVLHKGGRIRERGEKQTIGFDKCVRKGLDDTKFLRQEQALTLQAINGLRDSAQHYLVDVPEAQLYVHAQSGVTLFNDILRNVFGEALRTHLPERILPISTSPPKDMDTLLADEIETVRELLGPGRRRRIDARNRIRALAIVEATTRGERLQPSQSELDRLLNRIENGEGVARVFPGLSALNLSTEGKGPAIALRLSKKEGVPVQLVPEGTPGATVVAVHKADATRHYALGRDEVANEVGLSPPRTTAVIRYMKLRDDPECFRTFNFGKLKVEKYSPKAVEKIKAALPGIDLDAVWKQYGPKRK